jgi:subtilisin-like proprotein convertase family protein
MGWSQIINTDSYSNYPSDFGGGYLPPLIYTPVLIPDGGIFENQEASNSQSIFGWTQSKMGYRGSDFNQMLTIGALKVNPVFYTFSQYNNYNSGDGFGGTFPGLQPHQNQKPLGYYYLTPKTFKRDKVYQFNTILINYLQIGENISYAKQWRSPALYMVTPLGDKSEILADKTFNADQRQNPNDNRNSDTYIFPWPYFTTKSELDFLDSDISTSTKPGRIFTFHYYSSPNEDVVSHYNQRPTTFYSSVLFGNSHKNTTYKNVITSTNDRRMEYKSNGSLKQQLNNIYTTDGEGIVSHSVNETNWLVQGFSYVSLFTQATYITRPYKEGGNLFGNGWYVLPNSYVWYDMILATPTPWMLSGETLGSHNVSYRYIANEPYYNMPVGGPWVGGPNVDFPNWFDYYGYSPEDNDSGGGYRTSRNFGSSLNGKSKSSHPGFRKNNYIARYINQDKFNLSFKYQNDRSDNTGLRFYLSTELPSQRPSNSIFGPSSIPPIGKIIKDWSMVTDTINIYNDAGNALTTSNNLKEIRVTINLRHTWDGDLILNLKGPDRINSGDGYVVNLFNKEKGNSDNLINTVFTSDDTKKSIYYGTAPFSDTFKMKKDIGVGYGSYKSNTKDIKKLFNNNVVGDWTLYIKDDASLDEGILKSWSIEFIFDDTSNKNYIGVLTQSTATQSYNFYGLQGNQYIIFVADPVQSTVSGTYTVVTLQDLKIEESYHNQNNTLITVGTNILTSNLYRNNTYTLFSPNNISGYSYQATVGTGNTLNATQSLTYSIVHTRAGTGRFTSGIWEDGNWVNGWRDDKNIYQFFSVNQFFSYDRDKKWRFSVIGPSYHVSKFNVGDKVSISNIVAVDINEERKLVKNYFTIINKTVNTLIVEFEFDFPLRRIEKDSEYHFINISKNIWLNGNFFNGYFSGIWTNGLFYGYPFITEMYNSHWLDGKFSGGHFKSNVISLTFSNNHNLYNNQYLTIKFGLTHSFNTGDYIYVNEFLDGKPSILFGDGIVTDIVDNKTIKTSFLVNNEIISSTFSSGVVTSNKNTGLIQNIDFDSLNVSNITSNQSLDDRTVFSYNSWIDVVFDETSASNILKPQTNLNTLYSSGNVYYSRNNLYGYTSNDVLSSTSKFRDSFSTSYRNYKLGTKYKIFHDYIGDSSYFDDYFSDNSQTFKDLGWKYDVALYGSGSYITFSRTVETTSNPLINGKELKVNAIYDGGVLNLADPVEEIPNRYTEKIKPNRYTMVEFDLITKDIYEDYYLGVHSGNHYIPNPMEQPMLHFGNLNIIDRKLTSPTTISSIDSIIYPTYLPIYKNINHVTTPNRTKFEYFYNKRDLMMTFRGSGNDGIYPSEYIIDNLKLYEVDMIPFFKYFTYENINRTVQIPNESLRPYKKYEDSPYKFVAVTPKYSLDTIVNSNTIDTTSAAMSPVNTNTIFTNGGNNQANLSA